MNSEKLEKIIKSYYKEMHECQFPEQVEEVKKVIKKNVGLFERSSLLSFLLLKFNPGVLEGAGCEKNSRPSPKFLQKNETKFNKNPEKNLYAKQEQNTYPRNDCETIQLWTNVFFFNKEKISQFFDFVAKQSSIKKDDIIYMKKIKNYSFLTVKKDVCEKITTSFKTPVAFDTWKVSINQIKKEKRDEH